MNAPDKAKCPGCGDEEGTEAIGLNSVAADIRDQMGKWHCGECNSLFDSSDWFKSSQTRTLTDADIEAIAQRVVELMREGV